MINIEDVEMGSVVVFNSDIRSMNVTNISMKNRTVDLIWLDDTGIFRSVYNIPVYTLRWMIE